MGTDSLPTARRAAKTKRGKQKWASVRWLRSGGLGRRIYSVGALGAELPP